ncbi:histidinol dehydrogenase [Marine Group I thaumarchaeote]|uniref:Histidinol dehydrogenase n=1 Tax=Marine Group I thaumarchaeote TaxID=2511932 RepID=A0A7K4N1M5_9ARCH|nr:histidinol dehydrogenase [Marine Group I thaumarchaeote]
MKILQVRNIDSFVESRRQKTSEKDKKIVQSILNDVRKNGDSAVKKYERKFNGRKTSQLRVSAKEIKEAQSKISRKERSALRDMSARLLSRQKILANPWLEAGSVYRDFVPIPSVGCYIPGGQARYPSSVVMSVVPARKAGVKRIVVVSPPNRDGKIDPLTIVAAKMCGATEIYKVGGAQAIGALAYGTKSIPKVDKIVGPGGKFVSIAKLLVSDQTAIDMVAGPTELGIIADASSDPDLVALDLISQAEHSKDTMCFVITQSKIMAKQIQKSIEKLIPGTERSSIIKESISKNGFIAICKNQNEVIELANKIAPEHMELMVKNARSFSKKITGAGLLLIGKNTPSAASDYLLGTNHILPTNGFGRTRGGLSVLDFSKLQTIVESKKSTLRKISKSLKALTDAEDLPNHYKAVKRRLD